MNQVPAFCDNCGNIFPSGIAFENSMGITMIGNKSQCPKCGFMARIPDGVFNFYNNAIEVLQATETTIKDLQKFFTIIQTANKEESTSQEVKQEIENEVPKLSFLAKYLPQNAKELGPYLYVIVAIINIFTGGVEIKPHIEINPKTEINQYYVEQPYQQVSPPALEVHKPVDLFNRKIGRNEPCPCESGVKYKYCHGK
ncbi:SEC-C metal-binding domain-containing protein [Gottfriedia acidiceleris]|uniref:SEC-C metal-binding domain-containing protein n=1 Tax=Gottfriedia acidiceleris TaxID=371036 RepID=UPI003D212F0B